MLISAKQSIKQSPTSSTTSPYHQDYAVLIYYHWKTHHYCRLCTGTIKVETTWTRHLQCCPTNT